MIRQRAELTFKGNRGLSRHDWLRLTPAYSARLVEQTLADAETGARVLDPFGGSATTALIAAERGAWAMSVDLNPFLVWFARVKTAAYTEDERQGAASLAERCIALVREDTTVTWLPPLANIERWWPEEVVHALGALRRALFNTPPSKKRNLVAVAFARAMIATSNAAFNHQSMSFRARPPALWDSSADEVLATFAAEVEHVLSGAASELSGLVEVVEDDARTLRSLPRDCFDVLCTSPPYANRMSYIRELRPYMYWLGFLEDARAAGELDWRAIGGTWGIATSRVAAWQPTGSIPLNHGFGRAVADIRAGNEKSGGVLSRYVQKYFHDTWQHAQAVYEVMSSGARLTYIVGNSTFRGVHVPTQRWYAALLTEAGFRDARIEAIRKRNSNKALYEYAVQVRKP